MKRLLVISALALTVFSFVYEDQKENSNATKATQSHGIQNAAAGLQPAIKK